MVGRNVLNKTSSFYAWKHLIYLIELFFEYIIILLNYESKVSLLDAFWQNKPSNQKPCMSR